MKTRNNQPTKCFNCKYASKAFKIAGKTMHYCLHPMHKPCLEDGSMSAWGTLRYFYDTCHAHELKPAEHEKR